MGIDLTQLAVYAQNSHRALAHQSLSGSQDSQDYSNHCHTIQVCQVATVVMKTTQLVLTF